MKILKLLGASLALFCFSHIACAEIKHIKCAYLLEKWKMNDLAGKGNCPSGTSGLGKPWLVEVYSFDLNRGAMTDAVITKDYCTGQQEVLSVKFIAQPEKLMFIEEMKDKFDIEFYGKTRVHTIDRRNLKNGTGQKCEVIEAGRSLI